MLCQDIFWIKKTKKKLEVKEIKKLNLVYAAFVNRESVKAVNCELSWKYCILEQQLTKFKWNSKIIWPNVEQIHSQ